MASNFQIQFYNFRSSLLSVGDVTYSIAISAGVSVQNNIAVYLCADFIVRENCDGIGYYSTQIQTATTSNQINNSLLIGLLVPLILLIIIAITYWYFLHSPKTSIIVNTANENVKVRQSSIVNQKGEHILITTQVKNETCCVEIQKPAVSLIAANNSNHLISTSAAPLQEFKRVYILLILHEYIFLF